MNKDEYIIVPGTGQKLYEGTAVILSRLPDVKWLVHCGFFEYSGQKQKGWYISKVPEGTIMPLFSSDLIGIRIDSYCPHPPTPRPPVPPGPTPPGVIFTPEDKAMLLKSAITVDNLEQRDQIGNEWLQNGKVVRVNDIDGKGTVEYYQWNSISSTWELATLGYRFMTREEIESMVDGSVVDIKYSDSNGALVVEAINKPTAEIPLTGLAHNPIYNSEELTLRIPVYGCEDVVMVVPGNVHITDIRLETSYEFPDGSIKPALVITVQDDSGEREYAADATAFYNVYNGGETASIRVNASAASSEITADIRLSQLVDNAVQLKTDGLYVDISGKVDKVAIAEGYLLVADGHGGFVQSHNGINVFTQGSLDDIGDTGVVTANLITNAIATVAGEINDRLTNLESRVQALESGAVGHGAPGKVVVTSEDGVVRSDVTIGGATLAAGDASTLATEAAVLDATSWSPIE